MPTGLVDRRFGTVLASEISEFGKLLGKVFDGIYDPEILAKGLAE